MPRSCYVEFDKIIWWGGNLLLNWTEYALYLTFGQPSYHITVGGTCSESCASMQHWDALLLVLRGNVNPLSEFDEKFIKLALRYIVHLG
jgi:hypothetical protein